MKIISKFFLAAFFSIAIIGNVCAKDVEVEAMGSGDDYDWAVLNAVENAVRQSSPIEVGKSIPSVKAVATSDEKVSEKGGLLSRDKTIDAKHEISAQFKTIEARYHGKVKSYKVLSMEEKNDKVFVKILATVEKIDDYKSPELVKKANYRMAVMPFKGVRSYSCAGTPIALSKVNESLNSNLTSKLSKSKKFAIVDRQNLDDYAKEANLINDGYTRAQDTNKLKNIAAADYMIVGSISTLEGKSSSKTIEITGEEYSKSSMKLIVDYSIIEVATTDVIFSDTAEASFSKDKKLGSCTNGLNKLTDKVSNIIVKDSLSTLFPDYKHVEKPKKEKAKKQTSSTPKKKQVVKLPFDN